MLETISSLLSWGVLSSAIIGMAGFVIGNRVGKNNADRSVLRDEYAALFNHFRDIQERIGIGSPRNWADYPLEGNQYMPLVKKMGATGRINVIPRKFSSRLLEAETKALITGSKWADHAKKVICPATEGACSKQVNNPEKSLERRPFRVLYASTFPLQSEEYMDRLLLDIEQQNTGVGIDLSMEKGRTRQLYIYQEKLKEGTLIEFLKELRNTLRGHPDTSAIIEEMNNQKDELASLLTVLSKRINDPTPLFGTLIQSFRDPFVG